MATFVIEGGHQLSGDITPQGAKNEALQVICAVLLTDKEVTINNIPAIRDVHKLIELLRSLNVKITKNNDSSYTFKADEVDLDHLKSDDFRKQSQSIRGSIMIAGPLLARFGQVYIPRPGGDKIGRRRLDTHFVGLNKMGADFQFDTKESAFTAQTKSLKG